MKMYKNLNEKIWASIIIIIGFIVFVFNAPYNLKMSKEINCNFQKQILSSTYRGKVVDKFVRRDLNFSIKIGDSETLIQPDSELSSLLEIEDSIFKIGNKNLCILRKNDSFMILKYLPEDVYCSDTERINYLNKKQTEYYMFWAKYGQPPHGFK